MVDVWAVIGHSHTHKTTTVRALTGVRQVASHWNVAYVPGGAAPTYVQPSGLQEAGITPAAFIDSVTAAGVNKLIVALRYDAVSAACPDAATYLADFTAAGWHIAGNAVLDHPIRGPGAALPGGIIVPNAPALVCNQIAAQLRATWHIA